MRTSIMVAMLLSSVAVHSRAQNPGVSSLSAGDTLRVWAVAPRLNGQKGILADAVRDTLRLSDFDRTTPVAAVPYGSLRRVEVQRGKRRSPWRMAAGIVGGAVAGSYLLGYVGAKIECGSVCGDAGDLEGIAGGLLGGTLGLIGGGTAGGIITARMRVPNWRPVDLRRY